MRMIKNTVFLFLVCAGVHNIVSNVYSAVASQASHASQKKQHLLKATTPAAYLLATLTPVVQANNPSASAASVTAYVTQLTTFYLTYILPNLSVNLTTGAVVFVVPAGS